MRALLDTHALLWFLTDDARLGQNARDLMEAPGSRLWVSSASLWEIAIKHALGKLPLAQPFEDTFPAQLDENVISVLHIKPSHLTRLVSLPMHHRDPFDRLILAQSLEEELTLLTRDAAFGAYAARTLW